MKTGVCSIITFVLLCGGFTLTQCKQKDSLSSKKTKNLGEAIIESNLQKNEKLRAVSFEDSASGEQDTIEQNKAYFRRLVTLAEQGSKEAERELGTRYILGQGLVKNREKGIKWLTLSAQHGSLQSAYALANLLSENDHREGNLQEACFWMKKAADLGLPEAQRDLGIWYLSGTNIEKDEILGEKYLKKAAQEHQDADSYYILGELYLNEDRYHKTFNQAQEMFQKAAELDHPRAKQRLEFFQKKGISGQSST